MNRIGVYPGTFDPITLGHLQAIRDSLDLFDQVIALIAYNDKKSAMFNLDERKALIVDCFNDCPTLKAAYEEGRLLLDSDSGMLVHYVNKVGATHFIRGLRSLTDFDYEQQMNHINRKYAPNIKTWFVMSDERYQLVSSSYAKTIVRGGLDASWLLPLRVENALREKYGMPIVGPKTV